MNDNIESVNTSAKNVEHTETHKHRPRVSIIVVFIILLLINTIFLTIYYVALCKKDVENNIKNYTEKTEKYTNEIALKIRYGVDVENLTTYSSQQSTYNVSIKSKYGNVITEHITRGNPTFITKNVKVKNDNGEYDVTVTLTLEFFQMGKIYALYRVLSLGIILFIIDIIIMIIELYRRGIISFSVNSSLSNITSVGDNKIINILTNNENSDAEANTITSGKSSGSGTEEEDAKADMRETTEILPDSGDSSKGPEILTGSTWVNNDTSRPGTYDENEISNKSPEANNVKQTSFGTTVAGGKYGYVEKEEIRETEKTASSSSTSDSYTPSGSIFGHAESKEEVKETSKDIDRSSPGSSSDGYTPSGSIFGSLQTKEERVNPSSSNHVARVSNEGQLNEVAFNKSYFSSGNASQISSSASDFIADATNAAKATHNKKNKLNLFDENVEVKSNTIKRENKKEEVVNRGPIKNVEKFLREKARNSVVKQQVKIDSLEYEINKNLTERIENVTFKSNVKDVNLNVDVGKIVDAIGKVVTTELKESNDSKNLKLDIDCKRKEDGKVIFSIKDNSKENIDINKVFDPLYEAGEKLKDMKLATTLEIIKSHGGKIWAEKNSGDGKTIFFELDAKDVEEEEEGRKY